MDDHVSLVPEVLPAQDPTHIIAGSDCLHRHSLLTGSLQALRPWKSLWSGSHEQDPLKKYSQHTQEGKWPLSISLPLTAGLTGCLEASFCQIRHTPVSGHNVRWVEIGES